MGLFKILKKNSKIFPNKTALVIEKIEYLYDLAIMIWADNVVTEDEINTLKKYCLKFGFLKENIVELAEFLLAKAKENIPKIDLIKQINQL